MRKPILNSVIAILLTLWANTVTFNSGLLLVDLGGTFRSGMFSLS